MASRKLLCLLLVAVVFFFFFIKDVAYSEQTIIVEATGYSCMGEEKSRKETKLDALVDAKRKAVEFSITHIKSETKINNFKLEKDIINAYSHADVKILEMDELGWYKDEHSGDCFKVRIKAEIIPNDNELKEVRQDTIIDNPNALLNLQVWTDKKEYKNAESVKLFIKGNKPFYGRVICKQNNNQIVQLLPNPYRTDYFFKGGVVYEIPSPQDRFELEISPPFGMDTVILYGCTAKLGELDLEPDGPLYKVNTKYADIGKKTRGIVVKEKDEKGKNSAEFSEAKTIIRTSKDNL